MKKRILALALCLIMLFIPILSSCETDEGSDSAQETEYTALDIAKALAGSASNYGNEYNTVLKYTVPSMPTNSSSYYLVLTETGEEVYENIYSSKIYETKTLTVKNIKTGESIYTAKAYVDSEVAGLASDVYVHLKNKHFITTIKKINDEGEIEYTYDLRNETGTALVTITATEQELFEKMNAVESYYFSSTPFYVDGDHVLALNELYRIENGEAKLVKTFVNKELFGLEEEKFAYIGDKYVYLDVEKEGAIEFYIFDANLNFERTKTITAPIGYDINLIGLLSSDKYLYVIEKITYFEDLVEGEEYDFVLDEEAYYRDFYIYNTSNGETTEIDDILYLERVQIITNELLKSYTELLSDEEMNLSLPNGVEAVIISDMEEKDGKYYEKSVLHIADSDLNVKSTLYEDLDGYGDFRIRSYLSNGDFVLEFAWGVAVFKSDGTKVADVLETVTGVNDKFIVTNKGIYDYSMNLLYTFDENETLEHLSKNKAYICKEVMADDISLLENRMEYYSFDGSEKVLIYSKNANSVNNIDFNNNYYYIEEFETRSSGSEGSMITICTRKYYFYTGELATVFSAENFVDIRETTINGGLLLIEETENLSGETVYSYTVITYKEPTPAV